MEPNEIVDRMGRWSSGRGRLSALMAQRLQTMIDDGDLGPGEPLPTERALAAALAVGRSTVVAAYETLRAQGRIVRRQGSGTQVAGDRPADPPVALPTAETQAPIFLQLIEPDRGSVPMSCAAPPAPPPALIRAEQKMLKRLQESGSSGEIDFGLYAAGHPQLRSALAEYYCGLGLPTDPEQIMITNGAQQAISLLTRLLVSPGDRVLVEAPTYPGALEVFRASGADLVPLRLGMPELSQVAAAEPAALAYAVPVFHNPVGSMLGALASERLARAADSSRTWLIDDRSLAELPFPGVEVPAPLACHSDRVITLGSLSKIIWAGLRIGWVRAPRPLINRLVRVRAVQDIGGSALPQLTAAELIKDLRQHRESVGRRLSAAHDHLCAELAHKLPDWSFTRALGGQSLWVELPYGDGDSYAQEAMRHGVAVLAGNGLDVAGNGTRHLRLPFQLPIDQLTEAVRRMAAAWAGYRELDEPLADRSMLAV